MLTLANIRLALVVRNQGDIRWQPGEINPGESLLSISFFFLPPPPPSPLLVARYVLVSSFPDNSIAALVSLRSLGISERKNSRKEEFCGGGGEHEASPCFSSPIHQFSIRNEGGIKARRNYFFPPISSTCLILRKQVSCFLV